MPPPAFSPGPRFSRLDAAVLVLGAAGCLLVWRSRAELGVLLALPLAHFFLFCNVFRVARALELAWSAGFLALASLGGGALPVPLVVLASVALGALVVLAEARKPSYHGLGWQLLNPGLPAWWSARHGPRAARRAP